MSVMRLSRRLTASFRESFAHEPFHGDAGVDDHLAPSRSRSARMISLMSTVEWRRPRKIFARREIVGSLPKRLAEDLAMFGLPDRPCAAARCLSDRTSSAGTFRTVSWLINACKSSISLPAICPRTNGSAMGRRRGDAPCSCAKNSMFLRKNSLFPKTMLPVLWNESRGLARTSVAVCGAPAPRRRPDEAGSVVLAVGGQRPALLPTSFSSLEM